jgi:organic radical activating enzyme
MSEQTYRLSEIFSSIQGESSRAGTPSIWVRTFGCNLKCPKFACDSEYSWSKEYINDTLSLTSQQIYNELKALITDEYNPTGSLLHPLTNNSIDLVFTGGEPLLKRYQQMIIDVVNLFEVDNYVNFTIETNGTQQLTPEFKQWCDINSINRNLLFSISPKMESVSGEVNAVDIDNIVEYIELSRNAQIKIVANDTDESQAEIIEFVQKLNNATSEYINYYFSYWIMPVGETREDQLKIAPIVERYQQLGFNIATRNHTYIWSNDKGR